jgi:hypothetical protein
MIVARIVFFKSNDCRFDSRLAGDSSEFVHQIIYFFFIVLADDGLICSVFIFLSGKLYNPMDEWRRLHSAGKLCHCFFARLRFQVEDGSVDVGCTLDQVEVNWVFKVQLQRGGEAFQPTPEGLLRLCDNVVLRKSVDEQFNLMVKYLLENADCQLNTSKVGLFLSSCMQLLNTRQFALQNRGVLPKLLLEFSQIGRSVFVKVEEF